MTKHRNAGRVGLVVPIVAVVALLSGCAVVTALTGNYGPYTLPVTVNLAPPATAPGQVVTLCLFTATYVHVTVEETDTVFGPGPGGGDSAIEWNGITTSYADHPAAFTTTTPVGPGCLTYSFAPMHLVPDPGGRTYRVAFTAATGP